jgi:hypothetical protein
MKKFAEIIWIYDDSFRANFYTKEPFRMIGLIDVDIRYYYGVERVTLAFYRSSGTNSGKTEGLWYPIVGIKIHTGEFCEFTRYINCVLSETTKDGYAEKGWLAKSLFFSGKDHNEKPRGFSYGIHQNALYVIGMKLRSLYESNSYLLIEEMDARYINSALKSNKKSYHNSRTQRVNFERFVKDVYQEIEP